MVTGFTAWVSHVTLNGLQDIVKKGAEDLKTDALLTNIEPDSKAGQRGSWASG